MSALSDSSRAPQTERELINRIGSLLRACLPDDWALESALEARLTSGRQADAVFSITGPGRVSAQVLVEAKRNVEARDLPGLTAQMAALADEADRPFAASLVVARYLSTTVRERIVEAGLGYADATGNIYVSLREPALFLRDVGADRDPWRGPGRPRDSFRGPIAARVVRALADFKPPYTVPGLVERSGVSTGAGYRVVDFLERQDLVERQKRGPITRVEWRQIIELWSRDYALGPADGDSLWLAPRGVQSALADLVETRGLEYAVTGSAGAAYFEEYAKTRLLMAYAHEPYALAKRLGLRSVETGANVVLLQPSDDVVFERTVERDDGVVIAAPTQLAGDLLNGPGRAPAEAEALLDWMESNESAWRA